MPENVWKKKHVLYQHEGELLAQRLSLDVLRHPDVVNACGVNEKTVLATSAYKKFSISKLKPIYSFVAEERVTRNVGARDRSSPHFLLDLHLVKNCDFARGKRRLDRLALLFAPHRSCRAGHVDQAHF